MGGAGTPQGAACCQGSAAGAEAGPKGRCGWPADVMPGMGCCHAGCCMLEAPNAALPGGAAEWTPCNSCWCECRWDMVGPRARVGWQSAPTGATPAAVQASRQSPKGWGCLSSGAPCSCCWEEEDAAPSRDDCRRGGGPFTLLSTPGTASS